MGWWLRWWRLGFKRADPKTRLEEVASNVHKIILSSEWRVHGCAIIFCVE